MAMTIDTRRAVQQLTEAGVGDPEADAIVEVVGDATSPLVTQVMLHAEFAEFRTEFGEFRADMRAEFAEFRATTKVEAEAFRTEMRAEFAEFRAAMQVEFGEFRAATKAEAEAFRTEMRAEFAEFRAAMQADQNNLRAEMHAESAEFQAEMRADQNNLRAEMRADMKDLRSDFYRALVIQTGGVRRDRDRRRRPADAPVARRRGSDAPGRAADAALGDHQHADDGGGAGGARRGAGGDSGEPVVAGDSRRSGAARGASALGWGGRAPIGRQAMIANVKARYANGVLTPLEPLDLAEGEEVTLSIAGAKRESLLEMFDRLRDSVPPDTWDNVPTDLARRTSSTILYGHPKEDAE